MNATLPTAELVPDPLKICEHIGRLNAELKLARRLLRVAVDARVQQQERDRVAKKKSEVANAAR